LKVHWSEQALGDRDDIFQYLAERSLSAPIRIERLFDQASDRLARFPRCGRLGRVAQTRELVVSGTPFLLIYRVDDDRVVVLRALRASQKWPPGEEE
jgi:toxin ParE1/3/4